MEKKIEDYLHLYLGCKLLVPKDYYWTDIVMKKKYLANDGIETLQSVSFAGDGTITTSFPDNGFMIFYPHEVKPILRPLSGMKSKEKKELADIIGLEQDNEVHIWTPEQFVWLLSRHFDLFGLIEAGLAIDSTKEKVQESDTRDDEQRI